MKNTPTLPIPTADGVLLPARMVFDRYDIVDRTLDRWLLQPDLEFPRPVIINKRRYFRRQEIEAWERARAKKTVVA
jgi:predicted DNA-binding transcriptional regulator AlpA